MNFILFLYISYSDIPLKYSVALAFSNRFAVNSLVQTYQRASGKDLISYWLIAPRIRKI